MYRWKYPRIFVCIGLIAMICAGVWQIDKVPDLLSENINNDQYVAMQNLDGGRTAASFDFLQVPTVSSQYISPESSTGGANFTIYSFSTNMDANYSLDVFAYYEPIRCDDLIEVLTAYYRSDGTWFVAGRILNFEANTPRQLVLGIGNHANNLTWQTIGLVNETAGMVIAANDTAIRIVYLERNVDESESDPVRWVKYYASNDGGKNWTNGTLWDVSSLPGNWFGGISMAANSSTFECVWSFANVSSWNDTQRYNLSTTWETRDAGAGWQASTNLTSLIGKATFYPQVIFNQTDGSLYLCVANYSSYYDEKPSLIQKVHEILLKLGNGPDAIATGQREIFPLGDLWGWEGPVVYCALDSDKNCFYFLNATTQNYDIKKGIKYDVFWNASAWDAPFGDTELFLKSSFIRFNFWAQNGPKFFSGQVSTIGAFEKPGLMDADVPFGLLRHVNGTLLAAEVMTLLFNGTDSTGNTHHARAYYFNLTVTRDGSTPLTNRAFLAVDDIAPQINVGTSNSFISPYSSPGIGDEFTSTVTSTKVGSATLTVETLNMQINGTADLTDGTYTYYYPTICGDGRVNYVFFLQVEGSVDKLMFCKSLDGSLSWTAPQVVQILPYGVGPLRSVVKGAEIYCWVGQASAKELLFLSPDRGATFFQSESGVTIHQISSDLVCWRGEPDNNYFNISRSTDLGVTWTPFLSIDRVLYNGDGDYHDEELEGVGYDPASGNYSFVIANGSVNWAAFAITTHDGKSMIFTNDICVGAQGAGSMARALKVGVRPVSGDSPEWVIISNVYNTYLMRSTILAEMTVSGNGTPSLWRNFTGISGDTVLVPLSEGPLYDVLLVENSTPCVVKMNLNISTPQQFNQIKVVYGSSVVYTTSTIVPVGSNGVLTFRGLSSAGDVLPDGDYRWTVTFTDLAGQAVEETATLTIDNTLPVKGSYAYLTTPTRPDPRYPTKVTIPVSDVHLSGGTLRYWTTSSATRNEVPMDQISLGLGIAIFTGIIPGVTDDVVYWEVEIMDSAGNSLVVDDGGQPFTYSKPHLHLEEEFEPELTLDLSKIDKFEVRFLVSEDSEYIAFVYINYTLDDGSGTHVATMTRIGANIFSFTFASFPRNATRLIYTAMAVDIYGNLVPLGRTRSISLIPALPLWELSTIQQILLSLIALAVGIISGVVYSRMVQRRVGGRNLLQEFTTHAAQGKRANVVQGRTGTGYNKFSLVALALSLVAVFGFIGITLVFFFLYAWPEAAMFALVGSFLATVFLWVLATNHAVIQTLHKGRDKLRRYHILLNTIVALSIFVTLLGILWIGDSIAWWRVRMNQQAYVVWGVTIPSVLTTLATAFFSSILLLTWSVNKSVSKTARDFKEDLAENLNPGKIFQQREMKIAEIMTSVGWKGIIFVALIGATLIFASDLIVYTPQGMLIIIPFVLGAVLTLAVRSFWRKMNLSGETASACYDLLVKCPSCGSQTALGGTFCENCGVRVIEGTRVLEGRPCEACHRPNPNDNKYCRFCGNKTGEKPTIMPLKQNEGHEGKGSKFPKTPKMPQYNPADNLEKEK